MLYFSGVKEIRGEDGRESARATRNPKGAHIVICILLNNIILNVNTTRIVYLDGSSVWFVSDASLSPELGHFCGLR